MFKSLMRETKLVVASLVASTVIVGLLFSPVASEANSFDAAAAATSASTSSAQTVAAVDYDMAYGTAPMPDLKVTVSQTKDLTSQGIMVSWTGANGNSVRPSGAGGSNFMQIFQCWGDDPNHPGHPDRTTCVYGSNPGPGSARSNTTQPDQVDPQDAKFTKAGRGWSVPPYTSIPFNSATGEKVWDLKPNGTGGLDPIADASMVSNQFYSKLTSNEVIWAGSDADGIGSSKFEVQTASQSPGLGCGNATKVNGKYVGAPCWIVVLPRGTADNRQSEISQSGLFWDAWKHHIAIKLGFRPLGVRCDIGVPERQVQGSELIGAAFSSWQPQLCGGSVKSAFVISNQFDGDSLDSASTTTPSPLAITTRANNIQSNDPLVYAPLAVGGISMSFAIDRQVDESQTIPKALRDKNLSPIDKLKLTPRLLAKLMTYSYYESLPVGADLTEVAHNARNLTKDPDFLAVNADDPEWPLLDLNFGGVADVLSPNSRSYLAERVWKYVMSDKAARDFMAGKPDEYGMTVNPWYCTDPKINPSHSAFSVPPVLFPKSDPIEKPDNTATAGASGSGVINLVTWRPYLSDFETGALAALTGNSYELGAWNNSVNPPVFGKGSRRQAGYQSVLAFSTTPAAARFQTFQATLQNPAGNFVAPTLTSLLEAEKAMTPTANNSGVYEFDFSSKAAKASAGAYPLTTPIYAALNPLQTDIQARMAYANLIRFAVQKGQTPGENIGQLPPGYAPLSAAFIKQALAAASAIADGVSPLKTVDNGSSVPVTQPTTAPIKQKIIAAGDTPADPTVPLTAASMPFALALFICAFIIYGLLRKRISRV